MKEISFLKQNHDKWQRFEHLLSTKKDSDPDALADLFIQVTDDLSYAKTFYPNTNTEKYLNGLAARVHQEIYKNKKERRSRLITFWKYEVPEIMRGQQLNLGICLVVFLLSVAVGVLSAEKDPDFVRTILGDGYVSMTTHNIEKGDPMAVYKDDDQFGMFMRIAFNNVRVGFILLIFGCCTQLGPVFVLFMNGVMVGAFQYFFYQKGLLTESALTIWMHGTIEMMSFIVEAAAGMTLAQSIFFPGSYSRLESVKRGGRKAVKIALAAVPLIVTAAFIEAFITRYTEMHDEVRAWLIRGMFGFMIWYYVIYPFYAKKERSSHLGTKLVLASLLIILPTVALVMNYLTGDKADPVSKIFFCILIGGGITLVAWAIRTDQHIEEDPLEIERKKPEKQAVYAKDEGR